MRLFHRKIKFNWEDYKNIDVNNCPAIIAKQEYIQYLKDNLGEDIEDRIKYLIQQNIERLEK